MGTATDSLAKRALAPKAKTMKFAEMYQIDQTKKRRSLSSAARTLLSTIDDSDAAAALMPAISANHVSTAKTTSKKAFYNAKDKPKATPVRPVRVADYDSQEMTNVPNPVPDTGLPPPSGDTVYFTPPPITASPSITHQSQEYHAPAVKSISATSISTFTPLPPLLSLQSTPSTENVHAIVITSAPPRTSSAQSQNAVQSAQVLQHPSPSHQISKPAIIALSIVGGVVLLGVFIVIRLLRRPRRRKCPTPSLPILLDGAFPDHFESEGSGSPVFGGKERFSPSLRSARGNTGLWTWTQYHSGLPKPAPTVTVTKSSSGDPVKGSGSQENLLAEKRASFGGQDQYPFTGQGNFGQRAQPPLQPIQNAITRAVSRLSTVSMSLYPNSPANTTYGAMNVGVAIDSTAPLTGDGQTMIRAKDRVAAGRARNSMVAPPNARDASSLRRSQSYAYGGMDLTTPASPGSGRSPQNGGRARIKSTYYTPGSYPRTSAAPSAWLKDRGQQDGPHSDRAHDLQRSESHRGRETQALTCALGLVSPVPPSPHPTLYPDDSMSVIGEAKKVTVTGTRSQKKPVPKAMLNYDKATSPDSAALGSLMMVDFAASKSTASLVNIRPSEAAREAREAQPQGGQSSGGSSQPKTSMKKRAEDRPPRVPSPPPLPSLAQMALAHANPEAYAEYHSPTYSIYGLYDADRKSRGTSFGY
ncbi:hypothetical protein DEU56DRAFT_968925 [Suillus clintonianus]|uniref:uncharacterized protein n=1 Tax=Suillus clintonianus TaxID=1904413 RepID=UPI001B85CCF8|nr:uncharacterized protein DEU56DRAFT_968925 [Suillus clintonianus]KAG2157210.1 hypothetical protein DEU56DRAFT_968925 [Suillus clintonianus]